MNIWDIRNKTLRAIASWILAALAAVIVLLLLPFALVGLAITGVIEGARTVDWAGWRELVQHWWAAATGKEVA